MSAAFGVGAVGLPVNTGDAFGALSFCKVTMPAALVDISEALVDISEALVDIPEAFVDIPEAFVDIPEAFVAISVVLVVCCDALPLASNANCKSV